MGEFAAIESTGEDAGMHGVEVRAVSLSAGVVNAETEGDEGSYGVFA